MYTLAIETSCDETDIAVLKDGDELVTNLCRTQIAKHRLTGGVVPEVAARDHVKALPIIFEEIKSRFDISKIDLIAVTRGPGLSVALVNGVAFAKGIAWSLKKPIVGVNHLKGHFYASFLSGEKPEFPVVFLLVSGGHTELFLVRDFEDFELLGSTLDDASGEAFDKTARMLDLPYPGGPEISKLASEGDKNAFDFPIGVKDKKFDFSFSGFKTAVRYKIEELNQIGVENLVKTKADLAASIEKTIVDALILKTKNAMKEFAPKTLVMGGGVAANKLLRIEVEKLAGKFGAKLMIPEFKFCMDNAPMIGAAGYYQYQKFGADDIHEIDVDSSLNI